MKFEEMLEFYNEGYQHGWLAAIREARHNLEEIIYENRFGNDVLAWDEAQEILDAMEELVSGPALLPSRQ